MNRLRPLILRIPLFARKFIVDAVETGVVALIGLPLLGDRDALIHAAIAAISGALISAARRAAPGAIAWLMTQVAAFKAYVGVTD